MGDAERSEREAAATRAGTREGADERLDAQTSDALSFEGALEQLETMVARLEEGDLPLEEALELFENGVRLSRHCTETLEAAERRIEILMADRNEGEAGSSVRAFERESGDDGDLESDFDQDDEDDEIDSDLED